MKKPVLVLTLFITFSCSLYARQTETTQVDRSQSESTQVIQLARSSHSWNGDELPDYPDGTPEISILRITIPAGVQLEMHKHPVINAGVLISGRLTVHSSENETLQMEAGDSIIELVDKWHYGINEGDEPAEIIVFYAGTSDTPLSIIQEDTPE